MKASKILIGIVLAGALLTGCSGTYYVTELPSEPVYTRPAAPYAKAVGIPGDWQWRGGRYVYVNGYWARARTNRVYVQGEWIRGGSGYYWRRGHWR